MDFPGNIFTLPCVGMVSVFANELETGFTFNDEMTLMMESQLFLALTNSTTGVARQITCNTIIIIFITDVTKVSILIRTDRERRDRMTTVITSVDHPLHSVRGFTDTGVSFPR